MYPPCTALAAMTVDRSAGRAREIQCTYAADRVASVRQENITTRVDQRDIILFLQAPRLNVYVRATHAKRYSIRRRTTSTLTLLPISLYLVFVEMASGHVKATDPAEDGRLKQKRRKSSEGEK